MNTLTICCVAAATLGINVGWQRLPEGGMEYIIQLDPQSLEALRAGQPVQSDVPPPPARSARIGSWWARTDCPRPAARETEAAAAGTGQTRQDLAAGSSPTLAADDVDALRGFSPRWGRTSFWAGSPLGTAAEVSRENSRGLTAPGGKFDNARTLRGLLAQVTLLRVKIVHRIRTYVQFWVKVSTTFVRTRRSVGGVAAG